MANIPQGMAISIESAINSGGDMPPNLWPAITAVEVATTAVMESLGGI